MIKNPRFERKYRISKTEYKSILNTIRPFISEDPIAKKKGGRYFVRSLYFDSFSLNAYSEKIEGVSDRIKLRIRVYGKALDSTDVVSFEIKTKRCDQIIKYSSQLSPENYKKYLEDKLSIEYDPVLEEFERLRRLYHLEGVVLVDYKRDAFFSKEQKDVRITFDHDVRTASSKKLFPDKKTIFRCNEPSVVIMEIKTRDNYPKWLSDVSKRFGLDQRPNSKYAYGIENSLHEILR